MSFEKFEIDVLRQLRHGNYYTLAIDATITLQNVLVILL